MKARRMTWGMSWTRGEGAAPLAEAVEDAGGDFLLPFLTEVARRVLAHEEQHGNVVSVAAGDGGEAIGGAGAGAGHGDADFAGGAGVAVGDFNAEAFVAGGKGADAGAAERTPEGSQAAAGESGYVTYSFLFQGFDNGFSSTHGGTSHRLGWLGFSPSPLALSLEGRGDCRVCRDDRAAMGDGVNRGRVV